MTSRALARTTAGSSGAGGAVESCARKAGVKGRAARNQEKMESLFTDASGTYRHSSAEKDIVDVCEARY